jgi:gamma-glutamyltranspeptidase/glutathione hydrolase
VHHGLSPQQALDAPRWHVHEDFTITLESGLADLSPALVERGHALIDQNQPGLFGGGQVILRTNTAYVAGSDPRKDGQAVGC